jgi:hypothetical protein
MRGTGFLVERRPASKEARGGCLEGDVDIVFLMVIFKKCHFNDVDYLATTT